MGRKLTFYLISPLILEVWLTNENKIPKSILRFHPNSQNDNCYNTIAPPTIAAAATILIAPVTAGGPPALLLLLATVPVALVLVPVAVGKPTNKPVGMLNGPAKDVFETEYLAGLQPVPLVLVVDEVFDNNEVAQADVSRFAGKESVIVTSRYP